MFGLVVGAFVAPWLWTQILRALGTRGPAIWSGYVVAIMTGALVTTATGGALERVAAMAAIGYFFVLWRSSKRQARLRASREA